MATIKEFYIESDGIKLHAKIDAPEGMDKGPMCILIHGFTGHMEEDHLLAAVKAMNECGMMVLRAEMYGHGESGGEFSRHTLYKWVANALSVVEYAKTLDNVTDLYLCGHSQGGLLTMLIGGMCPDDFKAIIPLSPAWMIPDACRKGEILGASFDPEHIPDIIRSADGWDLRGDYVRTAQTIHVEDEIARYNGPVLIVHGIEDEVVPYLYGEKAAALYKNAKLIGIQNADHCFIGHEDEMAEAIKEYLTEIKNTPPWADEMNEGDHISYAPTYEEGKYFGLYDSGRYKNEAGTEYKYYYHDPDKNASTGKKLPLLVFFHGTSNSLVGELCIAYSGGECYASEEYQKSMGGAHVLIPLANEYRDEDGNVQGSWSEELAPDAHGLIQEYIKVRSDRIGQIFLFGNSSGATFCMRLLEAYMDCYDAAIPMGSEALPDDATLDEYEKKGKWLFYAVGKRDEFHDYEHDIAPRIPKLEQMKHCFIYTPDWVRNGDKGVASIVAGIEMGQHCIVNALHCNLMYDDGTPMDDRLPDGVTGWIADRVRQTRIE